MLSVKERYMQTNEFLDKWIEQVFELIIKYFIAITIAPLLFTSYYNYFILDKSHKSFYLIFEMV